MATTTETVTIPYSPMIFNSIEDLFPASAKFEDLEGREWVQGTGKDLLMKHELNNTFGFTLLHRHFDIDDNQILASFNNITIPVLDDGKSSRGRKRFSATAWKPVANKTSDSKTFSWMPYEFVFSTHGNLDEIPAPVELNDAKYQNFLEELSTALRDAGLDQSIGLNVFDLENVNRLEFTEGKANIMLRPGEFDPKEAESAERFIQTAWSFPGGIKKFDLCWDLCFVPYQQTHYVRHMET